MIRIRPSHSERDEAVAFPAATSASQRHAYRALQRRREIESSFSRRRPSRLVGSVGGDVEGDVQRDDGVGERA